MSFLKNLYNNCLKKTKKDPVIHVYKVEDYDDTYVYLIAVLKVYGLRVNNNDSKFTRFCRNMFYWFEVANMVMAACLMCISLMQIVKGGITDNFNDVILLTLTIGFSLLAIAIGCRVKSNWCLFENLISELRSIWPRGIVSEKEHRMISSGITKLNCFVKVTYWSLQLLQMALCVPSFVIEFMYHNGQEVQLIPIYSYWLPFDSKRSIYFEILLAIQIWHGLVILYCLLTGYLSLYIFLGHITIQFDLLSDRIRQLIVVSVDRQLITTFPLGLHSKHPQNNEHSDIVSNDRYQKDLAEIIKRHQVLIRLAGDVERIFNLPFLLIFLTSSVFICMSLMFCCITIEKRYEIIYKLFFIAYLGQMGIFSWHGDRLIESSAGVADAIYSCGWYQVSSSIKRSLLIMLHRSQNEVSITAFRFSTISLITFTKIVNTAFSYFTLLYNIYG